MGVTGPLLTASWNVQYNLLIKDTPDTRRVPNGEVTILVRPISYSSLPRNISGLSKANLNCRVAGVAN